MRNTPFGPRSSAVVDGINVELSRPETPEAVWFESGCDGLVLHRRIVGCFGRRDVADGFRQPAAAIPADPFEWGNSL
jgi:hypothetical protein